MGEASARSRDADRPVDWLAGYVRYTDWRQRFVAQFGVSTPVPAQQMVFRRALQLLFVKPAFAIGRFFWKFGDEGFIDRFGPNGVAALVQLGSVGSRSAPVRISLHLCLRHADRASRGAHLGDRHDNGRASPPFPDDGRAAGGAIACACSRTRSKRALDRAGATLVDFALGIWLWAGFDHRASAPSGSSSNMRRSSVASPWALGIDGIALMLIDAYRVPDADLHRRQLEGDQEARARIYGGDAGHGGADDRHLRGAGPVPVLHLLRRRPDPDVS
jgi:hypothetical protein